MAGRIPYSAAQPGAFTQVPSTYVSQLMRHVEDLSELKVTVLAFYLLSQSRAYPSYVPHRELVLKATSLVGLDESACVAVIDTAVRRGVFLRMALPLSEGPTAVYFANIEADLAAIEQLKSKSAGGPRTGGPPVPNVFELYEQNIGIITPMMAEELKDAQRTYPAEWIEEAFREAVKARKLSWRYISRILERWTAEGKDSGENRPGARADDPDKYVKGRYGGVVRR